MGQDISGPDAQPPIEPAAQPPSPPYLPSPGNTGSTSAAPSRSNRGCLIAVGVVSSLALVSVLAVIALIAYVGTSVDDLYERVPSADYATTITSCGPDLTGMNVEGTITNKTNTPHTYRLTVTFADEQGVQLDSDGLIMVPTVGPGQTSNWDGFSLRPQPADATIACKITEVFYNG